MLNKWECPDCQGQFLTRGKSPTWCPYCGPLSESVPTEITHCRCGIGASACVIHPERERNLTKEEKIEFRKEWDARVERGRSPAGGRTVGTVAP